MSLREEKFYEPLDSILEEINLRCVRLNAEDRKANVHKAHIVSALVVNEMRKVDNVFDELFSRIDFVGSYYDGLKVKEPTSFNMNLIMKLPVRYDSIEIEEDFDVPGFVKINCDNLVKQPVPENVQRKFDSWIVDGYLVENRPRQWLESVLVRSLQHKRFEFDISDEYYEVKLMKIGPAFMVRIVGYPHIDIIFAFTIEFQNSIPPAAFSRHYKYSYPWIVVSDTVKKYYYGRRDTHWRISFPGAERSILHNQYKLKYILRFLKAFRDAQTNVVIPSYFFTNVFLWQMQDLSEGSLPERFWEKRTGYLYVYMINDLYSALRECNLKYYWSEEVNLFKNYNCDHLKNMEGQLRNIIREINKRIPDSTEDLRTYMFGLYNS